MSEGRFTLIIRIRLCRSGHLEPCLLYVVSLRFADKVRVFAFFLRSYEGRTPDRWCLGAFPPLSRT